MYPYIHIFNLQIPTFGMMMLVGMIAAIILLLKIRHHQPYSDDDLSGMAIVVILTGFVGAKLLYWLVELDTIIKNPHFLLESLRSGFVFYGALIGGFIGLLFFTRHKKHCLFAYADIIMPAFILGQGFGRIGCFLAGCCYGRHTDSWIGVHYPAETYAAAQNPCIPVQLFESAFCILFCVVLITVLKKQKRYGTTLGVYLIGYGIWRFIIEFFRADDRGSVGVLSTSQFIAIFAVAVGIMLLILVKKGKTPLCEELMQYVKNGGISETEDDSNTSAASFNEEGGTPCDAGTGVSVDLQKDTEDYGEEDTVDKESADESEESKKETKE